MKRLNDILKINQGTLTSLATAANAATAAVSGIGRASVLFSKGAGIIGLAFKGAAAGVNLLISGLSKLFFWVSIIQFAVSAFEELTGIEIWKGASGAIKDFFEGAITGTNNAEKGIKLYTSAIKELAGLLPTLDRVFVAGDKFAQTTLLSFIPGFGGDLTAEKAKKQVEDQIDGVIEVATKTLNKLSDPNQKNVNATLNLLAGLVPNPAALNQIKKDLSDSLKEATDPAERAAIISQQNEKLTKLLAEGAIDQLGIDLSDAGKDQLRQSFENTIGQALQGAFVLNELEGVQDVSAFLKLLFSDLFTNIKGNAEITDELSSSLMGLAAAYGLTEKGLSGITFNTVNLTAEQKNALTPLVKLIEGLRNGTLDATALAQQQELLNKVFAAFRNESEFAVNGVNTFARSLQRLLGVQQRVTEFSDQLKKLFPAENFKEGIQFLKQTADGNIALAETQRDIEEGGIRAAIAATKIFDIDAVKNNDAYNIGLRAIAQNYPNIVKEVDTLERSNEKLNRSLENQLVLLEINIEKSRIQDRIERRQQGFEDQEASLKRQNDLQNSNTQKLGAQINLEDALTRLQIEKINGAVQEIKHASQLAELAEQRRRKEVEVTAEIRRRNLNQQQEVASTFSNLFSDRQRRGLDREALKIDVSEARQLLELQRQEAEREKQDQFAILQKRLELIDKEDAIAAEKSSSFFARVS
jgi:hypothetical protein